MQPTDPVLQAAQQQQAMQQQAQIPQAPQPAQPNPMQQAQQQLQTDESNNQTEFSKIQANKQAAISQASRAMSTLNPGANSGDSTSDTMSKVGGALNTNNYSNMCLAYVDDQTGNKNRQSTAYNDYLVNANDGNIHTSGTPPKGARVYFAPTADNPAGHIGLSNGNGSFTGATTNEGIKTFSIQNWENYASQQYIGWAPAGSS